MTKSFDKWFGEASQNKLFWESTSKASKMGFEAGQQSKQYEIDKLQEKIDDAINCLEKNKPSIKMEYRHAINALSILKGEETK